MESEEMPEVVERHYESENSEFSEEARNSTVY